MSQEDAHICSLDFDKSISLFAVFDGHGGPEVALYCAKKLPEFLKNTPTYKANEYEQALKDAFIGFDATLVDGKIIEELKKLMPADKLEGETDSEEGGDGDDYEDLTELRQESRMPIEELLEKLKDGKNIPLARLKQGECSGQKPISPCLRGPSSRRKIDASTDEAVSSSSASVAIENCQTSSEAGSSSVAASSSGAGSSDAAATQNIAASSVSDGPSSSTGGGASKSLFADSPDSSSTVKKDSDNAKDASIKVESSSGVSKPDGNCAGNGIGNECGSSAASSKNEGVSSSSPTENGIPKVRNKISSTGLLPSMIDDSDDSSTSDGSYTAEGKESESEGESEGESESNGEEEENDEDEDDEEEDDEEEGSQDDEDEGDDQFLNNMLEGPGSSSGCTAVIALLTGNELYVANAGDSRCVVCRNGAAVDMSLDHKPEDAEELERIQKAGGRVTMDGRVNGGLNLSRAIGDHAYKTVRKLIFTVISADQTLTFGCILFFLSRTRI